MSSNYQETRGFLPPSATTTIDELHHQPPHGYTTLQPQSSYPTSGDDVSFITTPESQLATALGRAIFNIRDAVATVNNPIFRTSSLDVDNNIIINQDHDHLSTSTVERRRRRNSHRPATTTKPPLSGARTGSPLRSLNVKESPQMKRLKKTEEMVTGIEQKCSEFTRGSAQVMTQKEEREIDGDQHDDNPTQTIVGQDEDEEKEECVEFKRLGDGGLRIQMRCSCTKRFEILQNDVGCFYRLI